MSSAAGHRRIDTHQHFWRVARGDYHWMPDSGPLRNDYLPGDLAPLNAAAGIDGTITVQCAQTVAETDWLLQLAEEEGSGILGVVGWAPLDDPDDPTLDRLGADPICVGIRPMIHELPDEDWIVRQVRTEELSRVAAHGLVFEVLSFPNHLGHALQAVASIDDLVVVIDHLSKPHYRDGLGGWAEGMRAFAERPETYCKLSGLVTEVGDGWVADDFRRHVDFVLEAFGPARVMFGTDWPVCLKAASHAQVVGLAEQLTADLGESERAAVFGGNAARVYGV
jgi:L-fuconolactonase